MIAFERITVPSDPNLDEYQNNTTWQDSKCVSMNEGNTSLRFYAHETTSIPTHDLETGEPKEDTQVTTAIFVRVPNPATDAMALDVVKQNVKSNLIEHDTSDHVNVFYCQGIKMWLDKITRAGLMMRLEAEKATGKEITTLWYGEQKLTLPIDNAIQMLNQLEVYASECYDRTQEHLATISKLDDVMAVIKYDYTVGYPSALIF